MTKARHWIPGLALLAGLAAGAAAQSPSSAQQPAAAPVPVTVENFVRAESDLFFGLSVRDGALGRFHHRRGVMAIDDQFVVRGNRDTLYSIAVFDLEAGPATVTIPEAGGRFMALQVIDQDQYVPDVFYGAGTHRFTREGIGTRYVGLAVRTLVNPEDPGDVARATALQDAIRVEQVGGPGRFEVPNWDQVSQKRVRDALLILAETLPDTRRAFGRRGEVDPVRRLVSAASAWGGNPDRDALYLNVVPARNDGTTVHRIEIGDVPVDGFWSISVYNAEGYYQRNPQNAYTLNSVTARRGDGGRTTIQFGGCDGQAPNCLPIVADWNYMVRLYRPRTEILDGRWVFPAAYPRL